VATKRFQIPAESESIAANLQRERLLLRVAGGLLLLAAVSFGFDWLLHLPHVLSLLLGIAAAAFAGSAAFALVAIAWRRVCGWRGHAFREIDVFPDGSTSVYECRHCGEHRYISREGTQPASHAME
jgi:hypothetical protein